ncbi:MAG: hypothetical protein J6S68_07665 [Acinetobacter sp.]|nr:hypothetical protein [Acinetobacter sp.]
MIHLATPLTYQQIVDGALVFILNDHGVSVEADCNEGSSGFVIKEPTNQQIVYVIGAYSGETAEIAVQKMAGAPEGIVLSEVNLYIPDIIVSPSLPWENETEGGTISLHTPLSLSELLSGELVTVLETSEGEQHFGVFKIDNGNSLAIISNGSMQYDVTNVDVTDTAATYNELLITKRASDSYNLIQAYKRANYFEYIPNLPMQQPEDLEVSRYMGELYAQGQLNLSDVLSDLYSFELFADGESTVANKSQSGVGSFGLSINSVSAINGTPRAIEGTTIIKLEGLIGQPGPSLSEVITNSIAFSPNLPWPLQGYCTIYLLEPLSFDEITRLITVHLSDGPQRVEGVWYEAGSGGLGLKCLDYSIYRADNVRPDPSAKYKEITLQRIDSSTNFQVIDISLNES